VRFAKPSEMISWIWDEMRWKLPGFSFSICRHGTQQFAFACIISSLLFLPQFGTTDLRFTIR
jgi:hypothetical protein